MALEHALLVALRERPAAGLDLARRFDASIGYFWTATHQQVYRVLGRMERDGWVTSRVVPQEGRPEKKEYAVTTLGETVLADWLAQPLQRDPVRSAVAVTLRGASYGDRDTVLAHVEELIADHRTRHAAYTAMAARDYPDPTALSGQALDQYLVLRGGLLMEETWIAWLTEYAAAHCPAHRTAAQEPR